VTSEAANRGDPLGVRHEDEIVLMDVPFTSVNNRWSTQRKIRDSESPELLNVDLTDQSRPAKRDGYQEIESAQTGFASQSLRGALLSELDVGVGSRLLVAGFPGGKTYTTRSPNGPAWSEAKVVEDTTGTVDRSLDITTDRAKCVQGNDLLWLLTPTTGTSIHAMDTQGGWFDLGDANESPPVNAVDAVYMLSRLWMISGTRLYWSKLLPTKADLLPTPNAFNRTGRVHRAIA